MLITDQVATAPCTDPIQVRFLTFEAKLENAIMPLTIRDGDVSVADRKAEHRRRVAQPAKHY